MLPCECARAGNQHARSFDRPCPCIQVELRLALGVGDWVDFVVHPRSNMDCDGVYIVDMQLWQDPGDAPPWEVRR